MITGQINHNAAVRASWCSAGQGRRLRWARHHAVLHSPGNTAGASSPGSGPTRLRQFVCVFWSTIGVHAAASLQEMLNIPAWNMWEFNWRLTRSLETGRNGGLFFPTDGLFSISKIIDFVWRNPWESPVELGDFLPVKERKFGGISEQWKGKE